MSTQPPTATIRPAEEQDALDGPYDHCRIEARWSARWEDEGLFRADPASGRPKFSLILLPPCVSAPLHLGHALQSIAQDILARYRRMAGFDVLWLPGLDFAPIATQRAVEKDLAAEGLTRAQLGRAAFDERVRRRTEENSSAIIAQLRALGASCDWRRLRYTIDAKSVRSARTAFVRLWDAGLVYQDFRVVNWCGSCSSVLSNRQLVRKPADREIFSFALAPTGHGEPVVLATDRPELLPSAVAVVVDPNRYGADDLDDVTLPLIDRTVPVIADAAACFEAEIGAFPLLAGHDPAHWATARKHRLEPRVVLDRRNRLRTPEQPWLDGLAVSDAREAVAERLGAKLLSRTVRGGVAALCECCNAAVEQVASRQWFVSMGSVASQAISEHEQGRPAFHPAGYGNDYRAWLDGLHDWCVSRQLWLGPRVPVFSCACGHQFASVNDPDRCPECGRPCPEQETDVLDSWFSQAMWQATALGWPDEDAELAAYYPTSLAVGSRDSLRLGLSRMVMISRRLTGHLPFRDVALTSIVLRPDSRKMDGAKGTAIYPEPFLEDKGADALRGWAAMSATISQDAAFDPGLVTGWRRVVVKLWNAARLVLADGPYDSLSIGEQADTARESADLYRRWIFSRLGLLIAVTTQSLETFELHYGARALLNFVRGDLCSHYLEAIKQRLRAGDEQARTEAVEVLDVLLRLLHPFLPFVTEELWHRLPGERPLLERCDWPRTEAFPEDPEAEEQMSELLGVRRPGKRESRQRHGPEPMSPKERGVRPC